MSECVFCMIASGKMPASVVYEDKDLIAFDDIMPQAPVHTLIIPRVHYPSMDGEVPQEVISALFGAIPRIAKLKEVADTGYRVIVNNGRDARQTVDHLHVHILGGRGMSHGMVRFDDEDE